MTLDYWYGMRDGKPGYYAVEKDTQECIRIARDRCLAAIEAVKWQCLAAWLIPSLAILYAALWV